MPTVYRTAFAAIVLLSTVGTATAQRGDRDGHDMREVWRDMDVPPAPVVEPADALETFRIAPGFRIELVAAEPLVEDPVAMAIDGEGRLWVVEMRGFMPNVDGSGEDEPVGRVVVLEDTTGDGNMDQSTVFLDELVMPRAISIVDGGVLVSEPPNLWFCEDLDGDLKSDRQTKLRDYARQGPVEHTDNALMLSLDNWIYNAKSSLRFKVRNGEIAEETQTHFRGQWGLTQDNVGRLYYNHNSHYLYADYFPDHYLTRNSSWRARHGINANIVNSNKAFPIRINPGVNRGYIDGQLREDGRLNTVTAISDALIYRGDQFGPDYVGDAFIPEPGANTIAHFRMQEEGVELKAEHITYEDPDWEKRDFLASTDERFRPVGIYNAPDGSIYVLDLYRGILQHKVYVTTYLRNYILEQGLDKPVGLGRIYRIVREEEPTRQQPPAFEQATTAELVQYLSHDNGWHRDTAQRLLVQRQDEEAARPLRSLAQNGRAALGRLHALWTLEGLGQLDTATVNAALRDPDPQVRIAAMRTAATLFEAEEPPAGLQRMLPRVIALTEDNDQAVRVQAAFTLGHFLGEDAKAERAMAEVLTREPNDRYIRQAVITGLGGHEYAVLERLLDAPEWAEPRSGRGAVLSELSATIFHAGRAAEIAMLIERAQAEEGWRRRELLQGMARAAGDRRSPVDLPAQPTSLQALAESDDEATRTAAERIAEKLNWPDAEMAAAEVVAELSEADEALRQRGQTMYMALCMACHQLHGQGQVGMAPSLVDSQYVLGPPEKLVRIALDGVTGVTEGDQKWNQAMPGMRDNPAINDERLAALLIYIRRQWDHQAGPVDPDLVTAIREATEGRDKPWTQEELEQLD